MRSNSFARASLVSALVAALVAAVVAPVEAIAQKNQPRNARPFEGLASESIVVLPVRYLTFADSLGWSAQAPSSNGYLSTLDDEIAFALSDRGLKGKWTFARDIESTARRNASYVSDPRTLAAGEIRIGSKPVDWQLHEPLASQLRSLVALTDARYILFPVEVRLTGSNGSGHALVHLVIVDARRSQVRWSGDLTGATVDHFSPAIAADLASRLADLIAAPN